MTKTLGSRCCGASDFERDITPTFSVLFGPDDLRDPIPGSLQPIVLSQALFPFICTWAGLTMRPQRW